MACSVSEVNESGPIEAGNWAGNGAGKAGAEEAGTEEGTDVVGGTSEDGGASNRLPLAFLGPLKVTVGSSRFQQFFFI